jgi:hypothetical protein
MKSLYIKSEEEPYITAIHEVCRPYFTYDYSHHTYNNELEEWVKVLQFKLRRKISIKKQKELTSAIQKLKLGTTRCMVGKHKLLDSVYEFVEYGKLSSYINVELPPICDDLDDEYLLK